MIETEKKYRLTQEEFLNLEETFKEWHLGPHTLDCEVNTLYSGIPDGEVLRLRKIIKPKSLYTITYKGQAIVTPEGVKEREEIEFQAEQLHGASVETFFSRLNFLPKIIYEKNRKSWNHNAYLCTLCLDELPFGYFLEIEGPSYEIPLLEKNFENKGYTLSYEPLSYPDLTHIYGKSVDGVTEARFA